MRGLDVVHEANTLTDEVSGQLPGALVPTLRQLGHLGQRRLVHGQLEPPDSSSGSEALSSSLQFLQSACRRRTMLTGDGGTEGFASFARRRYGTLKAPSGVAASECDLDGAVYAASARIEHGQICAIRILQLGQILIEEVDRPQ